MRCMMASDCRAGLHQTLYAGLAVLLGTLGVQAADVQRIMYLAESPQHMQHWSCRCVQAQGAASPYNRWLHDSQQGSMLRIIVVRVHRVVCCNLTGSVRVVTKAVWERVGATLLPLNQCLHASTESMHRSFHGNTTASMP